MIQLDLKIGTWQYYFHNGAISQIDEIALNEKDTMRSKSFAINEGALTTK